jgi:hypothetical protein
MALGQVLQDGDGGRLGQVAASGRRAFAPRETCAAGVAVEEPELLMLAVAATDREVVGVTSVVEWTVGGPAAETGEVVHDAD